jgi:hypothetical protein
MPFFFETRDGQGGVGGETFYAGAAEKRQNAYMREASARSFRAFSRQFIVGKSCRGAGQFMNIHRRMACSRSALEREGKRE